VVVTAPDNRPVFVNRYAEQILGQRDGLTLTARGLEASRPDEARALREAIRRAAQGELSSCATIIVTRRTIARPLAVHVPVARRSSGTAGEATVFLSDPSMPAVIAPDTLCRLYGLTRSEAMLAVMLAQGKTLEEAAELSFTSIHTVRTHLKRMLLKTETNRQADLVRLVLMSAAVVNTD
jgi:DNA-binding CsgD family transcriptional regulator